MDELPNSDDPQTECDGEIRRVADQQHLEPKSAPEIPCRRSARISAAKENGTLLLNAYEYLIAASFNKKPRKEISARRKTAKKVTDPCDCQEKFSMSSKRLRTLSHSNNASPATENECDQPRKDDEVTAVNLAHGSTDNNAVNDDKKDKVDDRDEIFKCVKMKTESKTNSDLKMKIKKCYKKSKRKEPSGDLNKVTVSDNGKPGVPNESGKKRKRETCRKQFRHKDITLYKLGSGPEKSIAKTKHEIQKLFIKCPTGDGPSKEATESFLATEKDVSNLLQSSAKENSDKLAEEKLEDAKLLESESTPWLTKAVHEEASNKCETATEPKAIPELRIFDDSSKSSIELTDIKTNKPESGKHNLPIRIPERRSSIAQPLRPTSSRAEVNFSVENMVESNSSTSIEYNGKILHRPYQSVESAKSTSSDEDRPPQVVTKIPDITNEELPAGLGKRCSGITDPLKVKENHLPLQKTSLKNDSKHEKISSPRNVKTIVSPLQSMPRLDVTEERIPDKVSPILNASPSSKNLKRKLSPERDNIPFAKQSKEERPTSYNFPFANPPLYNFLPTFAEYNRYLRPPHFAPRALTPYESYNTHLVRNPNFPQSNFYNYDYVKSLLRYSKQEPSHAQASPATISPTVTSNVPKTKETAILTIPVVRAASVKLAEESHEDEDLNAQTLTKIINNECLSVTKLPPNADIPKLNVGKKESGSKLEMEILRKELIKPAAPVRTSSPKPTSHQLSKVEPAPNSPLYVISDSETETDNEAELEEERNSSGLNLTKGNSAVDHKPAVRVRNTSSSEKKRIAHTLNTLTFVVNEIIDKSGGNMEKHDKDMLHKLLKGVRQNFELSSADIDESPPVIVKQENVIEIVSSDSENSNGGKDETVQQCLDLSKTGDVGKESSQGPKNQSVANSPSAANYVVVSLVSPNTQEAHATNTPPKIAAHGETCGIDLSLRGKPNCVEEAHRVTEVNNNKDPISISPVDRSNVEVAITRNPSPCRALESPQTVLKSKTSNVDINVKKESVITSLPPARPIIARRASYHPSTTTPKPHPNLPYKDTTYHNVSGNIELPRPTYQTNRNPVNNPQDSDPSSNLSTSLMKTFVCEYLRGGNQNQTQYSHSAPVTPKSTTATNTFTYTNPQSMQALQEYTNRTAYQAWHDELRRRRVALPQYYANSNERPQTNVNLNKPMNYNGGNPYLHPTQPSVNPYGANMPRAERYYGTYGSVVNGNVLAPSAAVIPPKNQAANKVNGQFSYASPNYGYFRRGGPPSKPFANYNPTKPPPAPNQKQQQQPHQFAEINSKKPESFLGKGRLREAVFNDNASPDYGYYSPQTKAATTVDGAQQYGAYSQNIEKRRPSVSSQHSSLSTLENPFSEHHHTNSNSSSTTSIGSVNNNPEPPPQTFSLISQSKDQAILAKILPKLQASDQPLTPEQYVREMNILEAEGCPKKLLEFYAYVTKKQIASNQRPIGFGIFLEFQSAGKLTVFEDAFKLYTEKRQIEKF
uniref:Uncharacterized protein n=1 Tax=Photinus pyralis TaxID=7054 RepID=A0A1Y1N488_PHOPY